MKDSIVIIDDEPITRMMFCEIFEKAGYDVKGEAADGYDAVTLCEAVRPDVALVDVKMPVFDGLSAAETIIQNGYCDCVILVTAFSDDTCIARAKQVGVAAYLVKPLSDKTLLPAVSVALERSRELRKVKEEVAGANRSMEEFKIIQQAKGVLAKIQGCTEADAYRQMRKMSMDKRCSIAELSGQILQANTPRGDLDRAKKVLMQRHGLSDDDAYARIKKLADKRRIPVAAAAREIWEADR